VKPGDSFWHFAIGGWLNTRDVEDFGTIDNLAKTIQEKLSQNVNGYDSPVAGKLFKLLTQAAPQKSEEIKVINDFLSTLKLDGDVSKADLMGLDYDSPDVKAKADDIAQIERKLNSLYYGTDETDEESGLLQFRRVQPTTLQSLVARRTQANRGEDLKAVFNEAFHVEEATLVDESVDAILAMLDKYSTDTWLLYQQYYVYGRFSTMLRFTDYYNDTYNVIQRVKTLVPSATFDYDIATLLKDCDTEACREIIENMRRRMSERIGQLDWLNIATKGKAQEKLQAVVFSIGKPDRLYNADFELTGSTAVEAAMQFMRQFTEYQRSLDGKSTYGKAWDYLACNVVGTVDPSSTNAFYSPQFTQLVIFPAYMMSEIFPADKDNAQRYAVSMVFGHELTHGFDPIGAKYDAQDIKRDWWTDEDKANFKLLQQQMIDRYHELEVLPGVMADGEKTLNENIADLGGVSLAYDLWNEHLQARGLTGEALRHHKRQFFISYAVVWNLYRTDEELMQQLKMMYTLPASTA